MDGLRQMVCIGLLGLASVASAQPEFESADDLLLALEQADSDLTALNATVLYVKTFVLAGDEHTRTGELMFAATPSESEQPTRRFAIDFTKLRMGAIEESILERYVFDGEWLLEMDLEHKQFTRRQIVPPGERFDPLRIGEGPLPIPIGQRRDDILYRFDAELVEPGDGLRTDEENLLRITSQWTQIKLVPKEAWVDEIDFTEIRLWYQQRDDGRLLPRLARTTNLGGDEATVLLLNVRVNDDAEVDEKKLNTDPPREGWNGQIIQWRG